MAKPRSFKVEGYLTATLLSVLLRPFISTFMLNTFAASLPKSQTATCQGYPLVSIPRDVSPWTVEIGELPLRTQTIDRSVSRIDKRVRQPTEQPIPVASGLPRVRDRCWSEVVRGDGATGEATVRRRSESGQHSVLNTRSISPGDKPLPSGQLLPLRIVVTKNGMRGSHFGVTIIDLIWP